MTRIIVCASGKGGVGKTTLVSNIGVALAELGKNTIALDANLTTPNLGLHLGVPLYPVTLHDVLKGNAHIRDAIYEHESGLKIIPAGISIRDLKGVDSRDLSGAVLDLLGTADIVLIDAAAGLGRETMAALESGDELLLITNPELPSVIDALKAVKLAEQIGTKNIGVIINRISGKKHEMQSHEISRMLDNMEIIGQIPDDYHVQEAISKRIPVVYYKPNSKAGREMRNLAARLAGYEVRVSRPWYSKLFR